MVPTCTPTKECHAADTRYHDIPPRHSILRDRADLLLCTIFMMVFGMTTDYINIVGGITLPGCEPTTYRVRGRHALTISQPDMVWGRERDGLYC